MTFLEVAPVSIEAAKAAGIWIGAVGRDERLSLERFALIAATARERGEPVCTRDAQTFGRFYSELIVY